MVPSDTRQLAALPNFALGGEEPTTRDFLARGCRTFHDAALYVWRLPYGRTLDRADYTAVLTEGRGTCSTKHALLAVLARAHKQPITLMLGIYEMDEENTPGVGATLQESGFPCIPEAHCYLMSGGQRVDFTRKVHASIAISRFLLEEELAPEDIGSYKVERHRAFVGTWARARGLNAEHVWQVREACIRALGSRIFHHERRR